MRQIGILRGPDEIGNVLILPTAARYSATYEQESEETTPRSRSKESQGTKTRSRGKTTAKQITLAEAVAAIHSTKDSKNL